MSPVSGDNREGWASSPAWACHQFLVTTTVIGEAATMKNATLHVFSGTGNSLDKVLDSIGIKPLRDAFTEGSVGALYFCK